MAKSEVIETEELPKCPYCLKELDKIERNSQGLVVYRCPYCHKLLGVGNTN